MLPRSVKPPAAVKPSLSPPAPPSPRCWGSAPGPWRRPPAHAAAKRNPAHAPRRAGNSVVGGPLYAASLWSRSSRPAPPQPRLPLTPPPPPVTVVTAPFPPPSPPASSSLGGARQQPGCWPLDGGVEPGGCAAWCGVEERGTFLAGIRASPVGTQSKANPPPPKKKKK